MIHPRGCVLNKAEDVNLSIYDMITGISKSKTLIKHIKVTVKSVVEIVFQIRSRITIIVGARANI